MNEQAIDDYLAAGRRALEKKKGLLDPDVLRDLAIEAGMSAEQSEEAEGRGQEATERARALLEEDRVDEAIVLLEEAILLSPARLQPHHLLAKAYAARWNEDRGSEEGKQARLMAIELAQHCLAMSAKHTPSEELLKGLGLQADRETMSWKHAALVVLVLVSISGTMTLCMRYTLIPDAPPATDEAVQEAPPSP